MHSCIGRAQGASMMRNETSTGMAGLKGQRIHASALCALSAAFVLGWGTNRASAAPFAYVTNAFASSVSVVDTATNQITATIALPTGSVPFAAAMTPDLKNVYVTSMDATST